MESDPREIELNFNGGSENSAERNIDELENVCSELSAELHTGNVQESSLQLQNVPEDAGNNDRALAAETADIQETAPLLRSRHPVNRPAGTPPLENTFAAEPVTAVEMAVAGKSYGAALRILREHRGLTYKDIEQVTLIQPRYQEAMENERLDALPPLVYVIAYIKTLCRFYKLSDDTVNKLVDGLRVKLKYSCNDELMNSLDVDSSGVEVNDRKLKRILWSGAAAVLSVVLLILLIVVWSVRGGSQGNGTEKTAVLSENANRQDNGNFDPNTIYPLLESPTLEVPKLPVAE